VHTSRDHHWHMEILGRLCAHGAPVLVATQHKTVDVTNPVSELEAVDGWTKLTQRGGEGMVVKPLDFVARAAGVRSSGQPSNAAVRSI
jgi:protein phosphatase